MTGKNYSDKEAEEIVSFIKQLSAILVEQMIEEDREKQINQS